MTTETRVLDRQGEGRFTAEADGRQAELVYRKVGRRLVLVHTGVPREIEGRGIGGLLVRAALDRAEKEGLTVVPICPYVRNWLEEHPDEAQGVSVDWKTS